MFKLWDGPLEDRRSLLIAFLDYLLNGENKEILGDTLVREGKALRKYLRRTTFFTISLSEALREHVTSLANVCEAEVNFDDGFVSDSPEHKEWLDLQKPDGKAIERMMAAPKFKGFNKGEVAIFAPEGKKEKPNIGTRLREIGKNLTEEDWKVLDEAWGTEKPSNTEEVYQLDNVELNYFNGEAVEVIFRIEKNNRKEWCYRREIFTKENLGELVSALENITSDTQKSFNRFEEQISPCVKKADKEVHFWRIPGPNGISTWGKVVDRSPTAFAESDPVPYIYFDAWRTLNELSKKD